MNDNNTAVEAEASAQAMDSAAVAEQQAPQKKKFHVNQAKLQDNLWGWIFCIPLIVGTVWFVYSAFVMAVMLSFTSYNTSVRESLMEYLGNLGSHIYQDGGVTKPFYWYAQIFTKTAQTNTSVKAFNEAGAYLFNTVFYMIGIPIGMVLSMFFAVCMSRDIKGGNLFRVLYYLPCVASSIAIVYTFKILFDSRGVMNQLLGTDINWLNLSGMQAMTWNSLTGKESLSNFMRDSYWCQGIFAKIIIIVMSVWKGLGGTIILYVAGLSGVNAATKEAAQIDGANGWTIFWKVTMPDLYPVIFYNIVTSVIGGLQIYAEPELLTGGPSRNTSGYVSLVWQYGLNGQSASPAAGAAYGIVLAIIIFVLTLFQFWLDSRNKD